MTDVVEAMKDPTMAASVALLKELTAVVDRHVDMAGKSGAFNAFPVLLALEVLTGQLLAGIGLCYGHDRMDRQIAAVSEAVNKVAHQRLADLGGMAEGGTA